jgi:negative regulator of sigma-B (phosphoserine phosphatase)
MVEYGVAKLTLPGQIESGDQHLLHCSQNGLLIAVLDGIGHGEEAANAAKLATSLLKARADDPIISLVEKCHEKLRLTRGVVLSLASIDPIHGLMTWLGVGNVQGVLVRADARKGNVHEELLLRPGVVGSQLPPLQAAVLPIAQGDVLCFATDGIRNDFSESLSPRENPQRAAHRVLKEYGSGNDDALVLVSRLTWVRS